MYICSSIITINLYHMFVSWNDGYNSPYDGNIEVSDNTGVGGKIVSLSSDINESLDRKCDMIVESVNYNAQDVFSLTQKGKRDVIRTSDGYIVRLKDGGTVNILK